MISPHAHPPALLWLRRDLRLADNPALSAAISAGGPVIAVWILDPETEALGAAHRWRLGESLAHLARDLEAIGGRLVLRRGAALASLRALVAETGARAVHWNRLYDSAARARDAGVKTGLKADGVEARSHAGHLLFEPWEVETKTGGFYKVYTPFWRAVKDRGVPAPIAAPGRWPAPEGGPGSLGLADLAPGADMGRGAAVAAGHADPGERAAQARLEAFLEEGVGAYPELRDRLDRAGTSRLSAHLATGEISPRQVWAAAQPRKQGSKAEGVVGFLQEIVWREFAYHLLYHTPELETRNWKRDWDAFPWRGDNADAEAWRRGRTGVEAVDAAMRELYVSGYMHNRMRMLTASFLTKHLMTDWRVGEAWFRETLTDWDPASNAMGWQWAAGCGPDAAPFFRIFNPDTQAKKFDPEGRYRRRWVAELSDAPPQTALSFFDAAPPSWGLDPADPYPAPIVGLKAGRARALDAYQALKA